MKTKHNTYEVEFKGVKVDVEGTYYGASLGDRETPPTPEDFDIETAYINQVDVGELFDEFDCWEELADLVISKHSNNEN